MLRKNISIAIYLLLSLLFLACQLDDQQNENPDKPNSPVTIANSEQFTLFSENTQQEYKIYIHLPMSYSQSDTIYPVIYSLDADIGFGMGSEMTKLLSFRKEMPEVIMVGIAYGAYPGQKGNNRTRDFTPTEVENFPNSGGAENFFLFLRDKLIPVINSNYRTNPDDMTLSGASLSGLFSLYVLFEHPGTFKRYKISSPSLWWDEGISFKYEKNYAENHSDLQANVFLSVGDVERTTESFKKFVNILQERNYKNLKLKTMMFKNAPHLTACILSGVRGMKALFSND